jgi:hypothetical protein
MPQSGAWSGAPESCRHVAAAGDIGFLAHFEPFYGRSR